MAIFCWEDILEARKENFLGDKTGEGQKAKEDDEEEK
jgi:hypothetical protein